MQQLKPSDLTRQLDKIAPHFTGVSKLKVKYRPLICPMHLLLNEIIEGDSCIDIGCGSGTLLWLIDAYKKPSKLAGIEVSPNCVKDAKSIFPDSKIDLNVYDGIHLPDSIKDYDVLILNDVFHHIPSNQQSTFLIKLYEKMKAGSTFIFKDIDASRVILTLGNKLHDLVLTGDIGNEISMAETQKKLIEVGFKITKSYSHRMLWYPHFICVCSK